MLLIIAGSLQAFFRKMSRSYSDDGWHPNLRRKLCELSFTLKVQEGEINDGFGIHPKVRSRVSFISFHKIGTERILNNTLSICSYRSQTNPQVVGG